MIDSSLFFSIRYKRWGINCEVMMKKQNHISHLPAAFSNIPISCKNKRIWFFFRMLTKIKRFAYIYTMRCLFCAKFFFSSKTIQTKRITNFLFIVSFPSRVSFVSVSLNVFRSVGYYHHHHHCRHYQHLIESFSLATAFQIA